MFIGMRRFANILDEMNGQWTLVGLELSNVLPSLSNVVTALANGAMLREARLKDYHFSPWHI